VGTLKAIFTTPKEAQPMEPKERVRVVPGRGIEGDRYFEMLGTFSKKADPSREITLIEAEVLDALARDCNIELGPHQTRRNLLTHGVALNHWVGVEFSVGAVRLKGIELCEPCGHLENLTVPGVRKALIHRGGLRAQVLTEGSIAVGDSIHRDE
jgi:MOSC domain-containing protein YiiM